MPKIRISPDNPYALSFKQRLVIKDIVQEVKNGERFHPHKSFQKIYNVEKIQTAYVMANQYLSRLNFRQALLQEFEYQGILDVSEKVVQGISEGLNAYKIINGEKVENYEVRLKYIQEVFKLSGLYQK